MNTPQRTGPATDDNLTPAQLWDRMPKIWVFGAMVAAFGWALTVGGHTITTINGVSACEGFDAAPFLVAGVVILTVIAGLTGQRSLHPARRLPGRATGAMAGVLLAAAGYYLASGLLNPAGSFC